MLFPIQKYSLLLYKIKRGSGLSILLRLLVYGKGKKKAKIEFK